MSEAKFTPGPWRLERNQEPFGANLVIYDAIGRSLMGDAQYYPWVPDNEADWHLIAAAPEQHAMLQKVEAHLSEYVHSLSLVGAEAPRSEELLSEVRALIAKAGA